MKPRQSKILLRPEQFHLLESCANQIALALEVDRLQENARATDIAIESERLRTAIFNSLSHELQNPLALIVRLINKITKKTRSIDEAEKEASVRSLYHEAERLNRLINNLLQITQLEEGQVNLHKKVQSIDDTINTTLNRIEKKLNNKPCIIQLAADLPQVLFDKVLLEQVLVNLIENAILYSPLESAIEISAKPTNDSILLSVGDHGPGLVTTDTEKVFEKFYRGPNVKKDSGSGLGLSVCESIIKAHNGRIWAENRLEGGAVFYFTLPLHDADHKN